MSLSYLLPLFVERSASARRVSRIGRSRATFDLWRSWHRNWILGGLAFTLRYDNTLRPDAMTFEIPAKFHKMDILLRTNKYTCVYYKITCVDSSRTVRTKH